MVRLIHGAAAALLLLPAWAAADLLRDPTQPIDYAPAASTQTESREGGLRLTAVFTGSRPSAVIGGRRVHVGDRVQDYEVRSIAAGKVELIRGGEISVLRLYSSTIIK